MVLNYCSSKRVVASVQANFNVDSTDWIGLAPEWIAEGLDRVGGGFALIDAEPIAVDVVNYRADIPCFAEALNYIEYNGQRLADIANPDLLNTNKNAEVTFDYPYYRINNGYIHTSFETGTIIVYYKMFPVEYDKETNNHYPLVPDDSKVIDYLAHLVLYRLMSRGYKHHTFQIKDIYSMLPRLEHKASNSLKSLSSDERARLSVIFKSFMINPKTWSEYYFNNTRRGNA